MGEINGTISVHVSRSRDGHLPILITSGAASAATSSSARTADTTQTFTVSPTTGWQQTSLYLKAAMGDSSAAKAR